MMDLALIFFVTLKKSFLRYAYSTFSESTCQVDKSTSHAKIKRKSTLEDD